MSLDNTQFSDQVKYFNGSVILTSFLRPSADVPAFYFKFKRSTVSTVILATASLAAKNGELL